ncbi:hypothetical protein HGM15179_009514, partial [Zosterops borbonicus]
MLFNIFINDIDKGIECTLSRFPDDLKLSGAVGTPEDQDAIQEHLDKPEKLGNGNLMKFNKSRDVFGDTLFSVSENGSNFRRWKDLHCICGTPLVKLSEYDT